MRIYSVAFFGHRYLENIIKVEDFLEDQIRKLIYENEYVDFLVGRNGGLRPIRIFFCASRTKKSQGR